MEGHISAMYFCPHGMIDDTWGRNYWDWEDPVQAENVTEFATVYMMDHQEFFPTGEMTFETFLSILEPHQR